MSGVPRLGYQFLFHSTHDLGEKTRGKITIAKESETRRKEKLRVFNILLRLKNFSHHYSQRPHPFYRETFFIWNENTPNTANIANRKTANMHDFITKIHQLVIASTVKARVPVKRTLSASSIRPYIRV